MKSLPFFACGLAVIAALVSTATAADDTRLLQCVPANTPIVIHVRSFESALKTWDNTPYAKMWADPEVRAFVAPAVATLNSPEALEGLSRFGAITETTPLEFIRLFTGEQVLAVDLRLEPDAAPAPRIFYGIGLGENRARIEAVLNRFLDDKDVKESVRVAQEVFRGTTINTLHRLPREGADGDGEQETVSYAFVNDVAWIGYPQSAVKECIVNLADGGASSPITADEAFASVFRRDADVDGGYYFNLQRLVAFGLEAYNAIEAAKAEADLAAAVAAGPEGAEEEGEEEAEEGPSMFQQLGLTPDVIVHALGLDELRMAYLTSKSAEEALVTTGGVTWNEQRGLLRAIAYGEAPSPQPEFVAAGWHSVVTARFAPSGLLDGIRESARTANPMFEMLIMQQLAGVKQQMGIDLEKDFFGALGDEMVLAQRFGDEVNPALGNFGSEQLWVISLQDEKAFSNVLHTVWAMFPHVAQQLKDREYLGQMILSVAVPVPAAGEEGMMEIAYAVTPTHLMINLHGPKMLEEALQRLQGEGGSLWAQPQVSAGIARVLEGSSSLQYQDTGPVIHAMIRQLAFAAQMSRELFASLAAGGEVAPEMGTGLHTLIDPDAVPSRETIAKYFGGSFGAVYRESDGLRVVMRNENVAP